MFTYHTFRATGRYKYRLCLTWILHDKEKVHTTTMQASRSCATMMLISLCAVALLLLPPASAELDKWPADSPAEAPVQGTEAQGKADDGIIAAVPPPAGMQRLRPHHHAPLGPEARRGLVHEVRCGPRVLMRQGFPWPSRSSRCLGGAGRAPSVPCMEPGAQGRRAVCLKLRWSSRHHRSSCTTLVILPRIKTFLNRMD
jgi:hypothetical protein